MVVQTHSQNRKVIRNANIRTFDVYNPVWFVTPDMIKACITDGTRNSRYELCKFRVFQPLGQSMAIKLFLEVINDRSGLRYNKDNFNQLLLRGISFTQY